MIKQCEICKSNFVTYPSRIKIGGGRFCSHKCKSVIFGKILSSSGIKTRYKSGHKQTPEEMMKRVNGSTGSNHKSWKGDNVGYSSLHAWIIRCKGNPLYCENCGLEGRKNGRNWNIHWANIDGNYRRVLEDYIALCRSCHWEHDIKNNYFN